MFEAVVPDRVTTVEAYYVAALRGTARVASAAVVHLRPSLPKNMVH